MIKRVLPLSLTWAALAISLCSSSALAAPADDLRTLRTQLAQTYPSLLYVDRYRAAFPAEVEGSAALWSGTGKLKLSAPEDLVSSLVGLADQHVALSGPRTGKPETLGVLLRTASDGAAIVWRHFDPLATGVAEGDVVLAINGEPAKAWLERAARTTFGGNRRGRYAEAATELGLGTPAVHKQAGLDKSVQLQLATAGAAPRTVTLAFLPMNGERAKTMTAAISRADLAKVIDADGVRIGSVRLGAFAPQFDPLYLAEEDAVSKAGGKSDDEIMLAGFCAVVRNFIARYDEVAARSDVMVVDLRGNLGGSDRMVRLQVDAIAKGRMADAYDLFKGKRPGTVRLALEQPDPSCGHVSVHRPLVVYDDAATRSGGEFMAAWLWSTGVPIVGETTVGAGGGFDMHSDGFTLPVSGMGVRMSGNFTLFAPAGYLHDGAWQEAKLVDMVAQDGFAPSRTRPFAFQAVGMRPDVALSTTAADLQDGGVARLSEAVAKLKAAKLLPAGG